MHADLAPGKHLLFDNASIADTYRLRRRLHPLRADPPCPVIVADKPWEGHGPTPLQVRFDKDLGLFRMWYNVFDDRLAQERLRAKGVRVGEPQPLFLCYAESEDGVRWRKPNLGVFGDTNIVFKGVSQGGGSPVFQPDAPPDERYVIPNLDWLSTESGGIVFAFSPDGIHWTYKDPKPAIFGHSDTWNCLVRNEERGVYMIYLRAWHSAAVGWVTQWIGGVGGEPFTQKNTRRRVGYAESRDLIHWSEPQIILTPDELDTNDFYALQVFRYADYYLGQLWIYDEEGAFTIDVELVWSHDGIHWERLPERPRFIPRGEFGQPDGFMIAPAQEPLVVGNEIWHYYAGYNVPHSAGGARDGTICGFRGRLRMDGFLSLQADKRLGALITRPFTLQNSSIEVNAAAHTGEIVAELVEPYYHEPQGKPIEGFSAKEFDVFRGDSLSHRLSWRGRSDLTALRGRRLMLRLSLYHAEIFSFTL